MFINILSVECFYFNIISFNIKVSNMWLKYFFFSTLEDEYYCKNFVLI